MSVKSETLESPLSREFFARDTLSVARDLVGALLIDTRVRDDQPQQPVRIARRLRIVEVEAYIGEDDPACHAARGKTKRNAVMYGPAGFSYVYFIYGMHHCLNVVTERQGFPAAVLIRAAEPLSGDLAVHPRIGKERSTDGPAKLCLALGLDRRHNGLDLTSGAIYLAAGEGKFKPAASSRIGVSSGTDRLWRFFDPLSPFVSGSKAGRNTRNLKTNLKQRVSSYGHNKSSQ